jgi:glycine oxidase
LWALSHPTSPSCGTTRRNFSSIASSWRKPSGAGVSTGYARSGRLQPLADEAALDFAKTRAINAVDLWCGKAEWHIVEAADHAPWAPISPSGFLVWDTLSASIHPRRATVALARAIEKSGGEIVAEGREEGKVLHATGWRGLMELSERLGKVVGNGVKGQAALLALDVRGKPQLFGDGIHLVPHQDGTLGVGSTSERFFDDPTEIDQQLDDLLLRAEAAFPFLEGVRVLERWAGVRPRAMTRSPMLGAHPLHEGQFIANGGFKIGFGMAPKVGEVMADLLLDGRDAIPEGFRPEASL